MILIDKFIINLTNFIILGAVLEAMAAILSAMAGWRCLWTAHYCYRCWRRCCSLFFAFPAQIVAHPSQWWSPPSPDGFPSAMRVTSGTARQGASRTTRRCIPTTSSYRSKSVGPSTCRCPWPAVCSRTRRSWFWLDRLTASSSRWRLGLWRRDCRPIRWPLSATRWWESRIIMDTWCTLWRPSWLFPAGRSSLQLWNWQSTSWKLPSTHCRSPPRTPPKSTLPLPLIMAPWRNRTTPPSPRTCYRSCTSTDTSSTRSELSKYQISLTTRSSLTTCSAWAAIGRVYLICQASMLMHFSTDFSYLIAILPTAWMHFLTNSESTSFRYYLSSSSTLS